MKKYLLTYLLLLPLWVLAANQTDVSLKWKDGAKQESEIVAETGDLFNQVAHHGPAIENEWMAIRIYFDQKCALDVYNKIRPGLELAGASWYPTEEQQKDGWGADQYKVGPTIGLGGVRLWDGKKVVPLDPVTMRIARVKKEACLSQIELLSEGVPYKEKTVDILIRVTAFSGLREMKVEAFALSDHPVQFVTGINYWPTTVTFEDENHMGSWGLHPEDVAAFQFKIGGGLIYNPSDFVDKKKNDSEILLISKSTKTLSIWISSACEKEDGFRTAEDFEQYVKQAL